MRAERAITLTLTDMQRAFVKEVCRGVPPHKASVLAGYQSPEEATHFLKRNPAVQAAISSEMRRFLYTEAAPASLHLMYRFMIDETKEDKLRLACAKTIADRAGYIAPKARENKSLEGKARVDMSREELEEEVERIRKEIADRSITVVDHVPDEGADDAQALDCLD